MLGLRAASVGSGSGDNQDAQMLDSHDSGDEHDRLPDPDSSEHDELLNDSSGIYQKQLRASTNLAQVNLKDDSNEDDDNRSGNSCLDSFGDSHDDEEEKQANADNLQRLQRDFYNKSKKLRDDLMGIQEGSGGRSKGDD